MADILRKDTINEAFIVFFGKKARVKCDRKCSKAWGINSRPKKQISDTDEDDYCFLADDELGLAPKDPGTYEGTDAKPPNPNEFPNRWCIRECERCAMSIPDEWMNELELKQFGGRVYNKQINATKPAREDLS